ncbi:hypothetical protein HLV35_07525 [Eggerthellaceae bacterium zg-997]|nr:hypothetical protein [Eggerthellaceae bacterium zg-997]
MMQLVTPADVEALLVDGLDAPCRVCAAAPPDDMPDSLACVTSLGGAAHTEVSFEHDVSVDVYAGRGDDYAPAWDLCEGVARALLSLPLSSDEVRAADVTAPPYANPDPRRPERPRVTFRAEIVARGKPIL